MKKCHVYVAGPMTKGSYMQNIRRGLEVGNDLFRKGFRPYIPHLSFIWDLVFPYSWDEILDFDEDWILRCDALFRIPGESPGSDREVAFAEKHGIPVFHSYEELEAWWRNQVDDNPSDGPRSS